jgi:predicted ArsR family transcriptional regulator
MDLRVLLAPDTGTPLGESRARVLDLMRAAGRPLSIQEVAGQAGLHPNTARFHLDALVEAGLATRAPQPRETPGRPSMAYQVTGSEGSGGRRRYRLLAEILTGMIASVMPQPGEAATETGREWGRYLTEPPPPYQRLDAKAAIGKLSCVLAETGFAPEAVTQDGGCRLRLHQCPFREVAERHQDVVCALHLGLIQGVLEQLRAPVSADRLLPFAEPGVCVAELRAGEARPAPAHAPRPPTATVAATASPVAAAAPPGQHRDPAGRSAAQPRAAHRPVRPGPARRATGRSAAVPRSAP